MSKTAKIILVATDLSAAALTATSRAARLARAGGDALELMHVIVPRDIPVYRVSGWEVHRRGMVAEAMGKMHAIAANAATEFHVPVTVRLAVGTPHVEIAARAEATGARLVVVGPHGERPVRDMFIGSTTQRLQRALRVPLLIARDASTGTHEHALVAIDFTPASARAARATLGMFPDVSLHFLHVCNVLFETRLSMAGVGADALRSFRDQALLDASRELDSFLRSNGLRSRKSTARVKHGHVPALIRETATEMGASLIVLGAAGKSRLEAGILGSVSEEFVGRTGPDILLANAAQWPHAREFEARPALEADAEAPVT